MTCKLLSLHSLLFQIIFYCVKHHKSLYRSLKISISKTFPTKNYFHTNVSILFSQKKAFLLSRESKYGLLIRFIYTFDSSIDLNAFMRCELPSKEPCWLFTSWSPKSISIPVTVTAWLWLIHLVWDSVGCSS